MPALLRHIDQIAREKQRGVLYVAFAGEDADDLPIVQNPSYPHNWDYEDDVNRLAFIQFLADNKLDWEPVGPYASESCWSSYNGNIYVDVPYDTALPQYELLRQYLENEDGTPKNRRVTFWHCSLEFALKNAHHDEPGFWENWADNF